MLLYWGHTKSTPQRMSNLHGKRVTPKRRETEEVEHRTSANLQLKGLLKNSTEQTYFAHTHVVRRHNYLDG